MSDEFTAIRYEGVTNGVARIVLARPDQRNAQDKTMLYELNTAFDLAAQDDEANVIVLAADGPHFSSGQYCYSKATLNQHPSTSRLKSPA
jgi:enoyl-CoA hydratase